jgi:hypothetical protein
MKKILMTIVTIALLVNFADARKKDMAGNVENGVYLDGKYNFSINVPDAWNSSIRKDESKLRVTMTKKQFDIPIHFQNAPNYTTAPKVSIFVDTTSMPIDQFIDSLLSDKYKSKQKNAMLAEMKIINGPFQLKKRAKMLVGELAGIKIAGQQKYTVEVQRSGSDSDQGDVCSDFFGGSVFFVKNGNVIIIIHMICEWRYFDANEKDFIELLNSFKIIKN